MNPNPKLIDRFNNRHIGKGIRGRRCRYFPSLVTRGIAKDIDVGEKLWVMDDVEGPKPEKGELDTRVVWVCRAYKWRNYSPGEEGTYKLFLRDLSPDTRQKGD